MTQWFYADDQRNRVGPMPADELREHYRQRRLRRDSLVWSEGMVQWLPLERLALELDIDSVTPDASLPPPVPPSPMAAPPPGRAAPRKQGMSGCLIALIVCAVVAVPMVAILAAIAIPAYNDYVQKAKVSEAIAMVEPVKAAIAEHAAREGACPDNDSADVAPVLAQVAQSPRIAATRVGTLEGGHCAFEITLRGVGANDGKTLLFEADEHVSHWDCSGGDLPDRVRPMQCRTNPNPT